MNTSPLVLVFYVRVIPGELGGTFLVLRVRYADSRHFLFGSRVELLDTKDPADMARWALTMAFDLRLDLDLDTIMRHTMAAASPPRERSVYSDPDNF